MGMGGDERSSTRRQPLLNRGSFIAVAPGRVKRRFPAIPTSGRQRAELGARESPGPYRGGLRKNETATDQENSHLKIGMAGEGILRSSVTKHRWNLQVRHPFRKNKS